MTSIATTAFIRRNLQVRTTVGILNTVRLVGTGAYGLAALLGLVFLLVSVAQPNTSWTALISGILGVAASVVFGALFYAVVGWFVDTLNLLKQIATNTATGSLAARATPASDRINVPLR